MNALERAQRFEDAFGQRFPLMRDWTLATFPRAGDDPALRAALAWIDKGCFTNDTNLYLHGPVGTGKTGLAWSLMRYLLELGGAISGADFVNVRQLLAQVRRSFTGEASDPLIPLQDCHYAHLLVLDDIGAERCTDWARETLATLIEDRYTRRLLTIFTSNYSPSKLAARLGHDDPIVGQRIVSRIVESCVQVNIEGTDQRLARTKEAA